MRRMPPTSGASGMDGACHDMRRLHAREGWSVGMSRFTRTHSLHSLKRLRRLPHQSVLTGLAGRFFVRTVIIAARKKHQVVRLWAQRRRCAGTPSLGPCRPPWNNAISGRWSHVSHASHTVKNTGSTPVLHLPQSCSRQLLGGPLPPWNNAISGK